MEDIYKLILPIKNATQLERSFSSQKQEQILTDLIDTVVPTQTNKHLVICFTICKHLAEFGHSKALKKDAIDVIHLIKSFSIKQKKEILQKHIFLQYYAMIFSRWFNEEETLNISKEIEEFLYSSFDSIQDLALTFYFDSKSNPEFNILKLSPTDIQSSAHTKLISCAKNYLKTKTSPIQCLDIAQGSYKYEDISQRFYNQLVYGQWGLKWKNPTIEVMEHLFNSLHDLAKHSKKSVATNAQKALIKTFSTLCNQIQTAESKQDTELLLSIQKQLNLLIPLTQHISWDTNHLKNFKKIQNQLQTLSNTLDLKLSNV